VLAALQNRELLTLSMTNHYSELNDELKQSFTDLKRELRKLLSGKKATTPLPSSTLKMLFNFRLKVLNWMLDQHESFQTSNEATQELFQNWLAKEKDEQVAVLIRNVLFAIRCAERVKDSFEETAYEGGDSLESAMNKNHANMPANYDQFVLTLSSQLPAFYVQEITNWVHSSIALELGVLSAFMIHEEGLNVPASRIDELSSMIAEEAQNYMAFAYENLLKSKKPAIRLMEGPLTLNREFLEEQNRLADSGMDDYRSNLDSE
jgi:hypothetical protein